MGDGANLMRMLSNKFRALDVGIRDQSAWNQSLEDYVSRHAVSLDFEPKLGFSSIECLPLGHAAR
jgi:hypothetical protein